MVVQIRASIFTDNIQMIVISVTFKHTIKNSEILQHNILAHQTENINFSLLPLELMKKIHN